MLNNDRSIMRHWRKVNLDSMLNGYIEAALWASINSDDESTHYEQDFTGHPMSKQFTLAMRKRLASVLSKRHTRVLLNAYIDAYILHYDDARTTAIYNQFGHDLWLTENGHGAGFWDRDYLEVFPECTDGDSLGDALTKAVQYREGYLYLGDDGLVYIQG